MIWLRLPQLRTTAKLESLVSREAAFLYNNLLLVALCLTILWGTAWPMVSEAVRGESVVVGRPYYDFFLRIFGLPLLLLMGIGPLVAWRRASLRGLVRAVAWPAGVALATGVVLVALGAGSSIPGLIAYTFSAFVLSAIVVEFARGTAARRALTGEPVPRAFAQLVGRNRRRYGGYVVHAAIVLLAIGVAGSSAYDSVAEGRLARGDSLSVGGYTLTYRELTERDGPNATEIRAVLDVRRGSDDLGNDRGGQECVQRRATGIERGRDPLRPPHRRGSLRHRRAGARRRRRRLPRLRQAARQPHLARRDRLRARLAHRALAGPAGGAAARDAVRTCGGALRDARDDVSGWLVLAAALAVAVVVVVALPFLREPAPASDALHELDGPERELLEAEEERDRALAALKELEADHRAGRLSDEDYRSVVGPLRQEAAQALRTLDRLAAGTRDGGAKGD